MYKVFANNNASQMYMDALLEIHRSGKLVKPRGTERLEIQAVLTYENPLIRTTFLRGRTINPFFQLAEALWIVLGKSDVDFLTKYNKNMDNFSDDGVYFHAPYGERLRKWNQHTASDFIFCPHDQLQDVYTKIKSDPDTSQAVASIWNPLFDNADVVTKDIPCNDLLKFKLRDGRLNLTVNNRSNDLHWGTFGANLNQFATIQELVATWLGVEVGEYNQESDSLHVYTQDYGFRITEDILEVYGMKGWDLTQGWSSPVVKQFSFINEPRMSLSLIEFRKFHTKFENDMEGAIHNERNYQDPLHAEALLDAIEDFTEDEYWTMTLQAMYVYQAHKIGNVQAMIDGLSSMKSSSWKVSCLYFLYKKYYTYPRFQAQYLHYPQDIIDYIEHR